MTEFAKLGVSDIRVSRLKEMGITQPTPVQLETIPHVYQGRDVISQAQTGTGKTLAFLLPMLDRIEISQPAVQGLILTPTRELALQITAETKKLIEGSEIKVLAVYGGQDVAAQLHKLKGHIHIVVATPGRLLDHLRRGSLSLADVSMVVLDEADQMLHMGFLTEVHNILQHTPKTKMTMLFSATMPPPIRELAGRLLHDPVHVTVKTEQVTVREIRQWAVETTDRKKQETLVKLLWETRPFLGMIFCRTKRRAKTLNEALQLKGFLSDELHGDLSQAKREQVMKQFREARLQFLVATDVAARGLDVEGITHVYNYDIPSDAESYIHRIGRTGRAGESGEAYTLYTAKDQMILAEIEQTIGMRLPRRIIAGMTPDASGSPKGGADKRRGERRREAGESNRGRSSDTADRGTADIRGSERHTKKESDKRRSGSGKGGRNTVSHTKGKSAMPKGRPKTLNSGARRNKSAGTSSRISRGSRSSTNRRG